MATVVQIRLSTIITVMLLWMVWHYLGPWIRETYTEIQYNYATTTRIFMEMQEIHDYEVQMCVQRCMPKLDTLTLFEGVEAMNKKWRIMNRRVSTCMNGCKINGKIRDAWNGLWGHTEL